MIVFLNDVLLRTTDRLKVLVWAGELAARPPSNDLHATFLVRAIGRNDTLQLRSGDGFEKASDVLESFATAAVSAAQLDLSKVGAGELRIEARIGGTLVGGHQVVVVTPAQHDVVMGQIASEKIQRTQASVAGAAHAQIWQRGWTRLFGYLNVPEPRHLVFQVASLEGLPSVPADACEFAAFHVLRFVFGEILFGGAIAIARVERATRLTIDSRAIDLPTELPAWLNTLMGSLANDGVRAQLDWRRDATRHRHATLDFTVGPAASV